MRWTILSVSSLMALLFIWQWVRSYHTSDDLSYAFEDGSSWECWTYPGGINFVRSDMPLKPGGGWHLQSEEQIQTGGTLGPNEGVHFAGFAFAIPRHTYKYREEVAEVPFWFLLLLAIATPLGFVLRTARHTARGRRDAPVSNGAPDALRPHRWARQAIAGLLVLILLAIIAWDWTQLFPRPEAMAAPITPHVQLPAGTKSVKEILTQLVHERSALTQWTSDRSDRISHLLEDAHANDNFADGKRAAADLDEVIRLDPDDDTAEQLRDQINGYYGPPSPYAGPSTITNSIGMTLAYIAPGTFTMGTPTSLRRPGDEAQVQHPVSLRRGFFMAAHHVTVAQFRAFVLDTGYQTVAEQEEAQGDWQNCYEQAESHPVVWIGWSDAVAFADWLSAKESRAYHLPTEAQWEYCCRAGTMTIYPWGDNPDDGKGWANCADQSLKALGFTSETFNWNDGFARTSPVGSFRSNAFGLYDMIGNAGQWCSDRAIRGGSWLSGPFVTCCWRHQGLPNPRPDCGFRLVMQPSDDRQP